MKTYCSEKSKLFVALRIVCLLGSLHAEDVFELVESTKLQSYSDITFFLRLPKIAESYKANEHDRGGNAYRVGGVLALCMHRTELEDVKINVSKDGRFEWFVQFADKHNLALVTWTNFKGYRTDISGDL
mgnify:CR=1 FL=1